MGIKVIQNVYPEISGTTGIALTPVSVRANPRTVNHLGRSAHRSGRQSKIARQVMHDARAASSNSSPALAISWRLATLYLFRLYGDAAEIDDSKLRAYRWPSDQNAPSSRTSTFCGSRDQ